MPWSGPQFAQRHNHSLTPEQAAHAARIANAILRRSGNEGMAIATANRDMQRRDYGGGVDTTDPGTATYADTGQAPTAQTMSPLVQGQIQRYSAMSPDQLQQLAVMMGGTPQGQLVQRVLQQKRMRPEQMQQPQGRQAQQPAPPTPQQQAQQVMQQAAQSDASGGPVRRQTPSQAWIDRLPYGHDDQSFSQDRRMAIRPNMDIDDGITAGPQPPRVTNEQASGGIVAHRDMGGLMSMSDAVPSWTRQEERGANTGFLHGSTPGRADSILGTAPGGSYVIPADVVSGLGEGNSLAGARAVEEMLSTGPHGIPMPRARAGMGPPRPPAPFHESNGGFVPAARMWKGPTKLYRAGGVAGKGNEAVALSDGEYVLAPEHVARIGGGDHGKGIKALDDFVLKQRAKHIAKLKGLPPPVGAKK